MLFDYCLFFGGALYLLMGRHILFLSTHRRQEKNQRGEEEEEEEAACIVCNYCVFTTVEKGQRRDCWNGKEWTGQERTESILFEHGGYLVLPSLSLCVGLLSSNSHHNCSSGFLKEVRYRCAHERGRCCIRETCVGSIS
jgi:hypothetical protein